MTRIVDACAWPDCFRPADRDRKGVYLCTRHGDELAGGFEFDVRLTFHQHPTTGRVFPVLLLPPEALVVMSRHVYRSPDTVQETSAEEGIRDFLSFLSLVFSPESAL